MSTFLRKEEKDRPCDGSQGGSRTPTVSATSSPTGGTMSRSDLTRRPLAAALVAAPLLWLAAELVSPTLKSNAAAQLDVIAANSGRWLGYTILLTLGTILFVPAILAIMHITRAGAPKLSAIGGALLGYGAIIAVGDAMSQLMVWQMAAPGANRSQMAALMDRFDNAGGAQVFFGPGGLAFALGTILLTIALIRTRAVPVWASVTFLVGILAQLAGFTNSSVGMLAASSVVLLVAMSAMAARLWTGRRVVAAADSAKRDFLPAI